MLGHSNKYGVRRIAKAIILKLNPGTMEPCDACAAGKSKQKMIKKKQKPENNKGAHIYIGIATVNKPQNLHATVKKTQQKIGFDEGTGHKTSIFYYKKNDQI